jgi:chromosome segregation ATPase
MKCVHHEPRSRVTSVAAALALLAFAGCSQPKPEPEIASSATEPSYAQEYPAAVAGEAEAFGKGQVELDRLGQGFKKYPDELEGDVRWAEVAEVLEQADRVGRNRAYHDAIQDLTAVRKFYDEEREPLAKKVAGSAQYAAKEKGCDAEVGSAAAGGLDKGMDERLEERLRRANDAQRLVDRYREPLGKKNAATLERQANEVSRASYLARIELVERKVRLRAMIEEAETVKSTAAAAIDAERGYQSSPGRSDKDKEGAHARIEAMKKAQSSLDAAVDNAKQLAQDMDQRIAEAQSKYDQALQQMLEAVRSRAKH